MPGNGSIVATRSSIWRVLYYCGGIIAIAVHAGAAIGLFGARMYPREAPNVTTVTGPDAYGYVHTYSHSSEWVMFFVILTAFVGAPFVAANLIREAALTGLEGWRRDFGRICGALALVVWILCYYLAVRAIVLLRA